MTNFLKIENPTITWTGYGDDVIGHDRKLKNELPNTNFPQITMQKELGRYLLPVFRKKYKTVRHLKKYPPLLYCPMCRLYNRSSGNFRIGFKFRQGDLI